MLISKEVSTILSDPSRKPAGLDDETAKRLAGTFGFDETSPSSIKEVQYHLSFQSRVGPVTWLQ
jgi:hypothetical protein